MVKGICEICESTDRRMVRDHNHVNGMIRGILCDQCNSWIGVYEYNIRENADEGKKRYKDWLSKYRVIIIAYLQQDKGIRYNLNTPKGYPSKKVIHA